MGPADLAPTHFDRDHQTRERLFPGSSNHIFETDQGGFVPLPIALRKLL